MLDFNPLKHNCTGCSACYSVCPTSCISMSEDAEGFLYPELNTEKCIKCRLCERVCPIVNPIQIDRHSPQIVAAVSKNARIWRASASGGAFSEICNAWADDSTLIVGAAWNGMTVRHLSVKGPKNMAPLRKSKYIASSIDNTYKEVRNSLGKGQKVIFSGTPCQVAGLRSFLRKDFDNLLLIDLICHGVGSPLVFKSCIKTIEKQFGKLIKSYEFRAKRFYFETNYISHVIFRDGSSEYISMDQYNQLFLEQTCLRPSCGESCRFRGKDIRPGDLTIADCKGLFEIFPQLIGTKHNYSTIITNTTKGDTTLELLGTRMERYDYTLDDLIKYNPLFDRQTWASTERDAFFDNYTRAPEDTIEKWTKPFSVSKLSIRGVVFGLLPVWLRRCFFRLTNRA